jgi:transposase InsO family protein
MPAVITGRRWRPRHAVQHESQGGLLGQCPHGELLHTLKTELVHHQDYQGRWEAKADTFEYVEVFYNRSRRHSALRYLTPAEYEMSKMAA